MGFPTSRVGGGLKHQFQFQRPGLQRIAVVVGCRPESGAGGAPNTADVSKASVAKVEGDLTPNTQKWLANSTVAILNHWFQPVPQILGLDKTNYYIGKCITNRDDVMKNLLSAFESLLNENFCCNGKFIVNR